MADQKCDVAEPASKVFRPWECVSDTRQPCTVSMMTSSPNNTSITSRTLQTAPHVMLSPPSMMTSPVMTSRWMDMTTPKHASPLNDSAYFTGQSSPDISPEPVAFACRRRRYLERQAVQLMEDWYSDNLSHPYPTADVVDSLAARGGLTAAQVKKWMANKRVRSSNTLSFNRSVHPKRLKRLRRMNEQHNTSPSATTSPVHAAHAPQVRLRNDVIQILSDWFDNHKENPYPTEEEKEQLGEATGLKRSQVSTWFANRRSRFRSKGNPLEKRDSAQQREPAEVRHRIAHQVEPSVLHMRSISDCQSNMMCFPWSIPHAYSPQQQTSTRHVLHQLHSNHVTASHHVTVAMRRDLFGMQH